MTARLRGLAAAVAFIVAAAVGATYLLAHGFAGAASAAAPAEQFAVLFATTVGSGEDARAFEMLCPEAQKDCSLQDFCARAEEARTALGRFRAEPVASAVSGSLQVERARSRFATTLMLKGDKAPGMASIDLVRAGHGPWVVRNWSWTPANAR